MVEWVLLALLTHLRRWDEYRELQRLGRYEELPVPVPSEVVVGILGFGVLGRATGEVLQHIGYRVRGWSLSQKPVAAVERFAGEDELGDLLSGCDVAVCMLPLTAQTEVLLALRNQSEQKFKVLASTRSVIASRCRYGGDGTFANALAIPPVS